MTSRLSPRHGFAALGGICAGLAVRHVVFAGEGVGTLLESVLILGLSTVAFYTAYDVRRWGISRSGQWRAVRISAVTALLFSALAAVVWLIWVLEHHAFKLSFLLSFAASLGAAVGSRGSLYAVKAAEQLTEAQELTTLLSINDRVLRHNIRNELSVAFGYLEGIGEADDWEAVSERARIIRSHLGDLIETSERTRRIASIRRTDTLRPIDLVAVVEERVSRLTTDASGVTIRTDLRGDCVVRAHPALPLAIEEAIRNAIEHNEDDVEITVRVRRHGDGGASVVIADTGRGIPRIERQTLQNAEETPLEHTEGLGLWLIYWAVRQSDGTVEFTDNDPRGTAVRIHLPGRSGTNCREAGSDRSGPVDSDPSDPESDLRDDHV